MFYFADYILFADRVQKIGSPGFYPNISNNTVVISIEDTTPYPEFITHYIAYDLIDFTKKELPQTIRKKLNYDSSNSYRLFNSLNGGGGNPDTKFNHLKYLGSRVTGNKFKIGSKWDIVLTNTGLGGGGAESKFLQYGFSYYEVILNNQIANFKMDYQIDLAYFFEFNSKQNDTVYICNVNDIYKIYKR